MSQATDAPKSPKKHKRRPSSGGESPERKASSPPTSPITVASTDNSDVSPSSSPSRRRRNRDADSSTQPENNTSTTTNSSSSNSNSANVTDASSPSSSPRRRRRTASASQSPTLTRRSVDALGKSPKSPHSPKSGKEKEKDKSDKDRHGRRARRHSPVVDMASLAADVSLIGVLVDRSDAWCLVIARALSTRELGTLALVSKSMNAIVNSREMVSPFTSTRKLAPHFLTHSNRLFSIAQWFERCRACFDVFSPARSTYDWQMVFEQLMHVFLTWHHTVTIYGRSTLVAAGENSLALTLTARPKRSLAFITRMWKQPNTRQYRVMLRQASFGANVELHFTFRWPTAAFVAKFCGRSNLPPSSIVAPHDFVPNEVDTDALVVVDATTAAPGQQYCGRILS